MINFQSLKYVSKDNKAGLGVFGVTIILGLTVNVFIVAVNFLDWFKLKHIKPCDKIIVLIATSRLCFHCLSVLDIYFAVYTEQSPSMDAVYCIVDFSMLFSNCTSLWYVSLLAVLFCLKVANYSNGLFVFVKTVILRRFSFFIVTITMISFFSRAMFMWADDLSFISKSNLSSAQLNQTYYWSDENTLATIFILGYCGPFIIHSLSSYVLITSLCRHMNQMKNNSNGFSTTHLDAYYVAIKSLSGCFLIYCVNVCTNIYNFFYYSEIGILKANTLLNVLPILHSAYLVYRDNKMRQRLQAILRSMANGLMIKRGIIPFVGEQDTVT